MKKVYSSTESMQVIEFYEQINQMLINGWRIEKKKEDFAATDPKTGIVYLGPTLEILLGHVRWNREE